MSTDVPQPADEEFNRGLRLPLFEPSDGPVPAAAVPRGPRAERSLEDPTAPVAPVGDNGEGPRESQLGHPPQPGSDRAASHAMPGSEAGTDTNLGSPEVISTGLARNFESGVLPGSSVSMFVDSYERLGGRLLGRMRDLREDMDANLGDLRSELASLRTIVEDVGDKVQLRQMRSSIEGLRTEVSDLRRVVLERPELERVASDVHEFAELRDEMVALRRRIALRTATEGPTLGPEDVDAIAEAITERLLTVIRPR